MPRAMSRPSEPEEMPSMSIALSFLPSRMTEPLPNWRSIWVSAADRAFDLSIEDPSTRRRAGWLILRSLWRRFGGSTTRGLLAAPESTDGQDCTLFVPSSQYVLFWGGVLA